jgi:hypothetical protein
MSARRRRLDRLERRLPPPPDPPPARELTVADLEEAAQRWVYNLACCGTPTYLFARDEPDFERLWLAYHQADNRYRWTRRPQGGWYYDGRVALTRVWVARAEPDVEAARRAVLHSMVRVLAAATEPAGHVPAFRALGTFLALADGREEGRDESTPSPGQAGAGAAADRGAED